MTAHPPALSPREGVTPVLLLRSFRVIDFRPPWGGPAES